MTKRKALITGITGQDGSYLTEFLLEKGYAVYGVIRKSSTFSTERLDHLNINPNFKNLHLLYGDLQDASGFINLIHEIKPTEIYNLAAQSHVKVSFQTPVGTCDVAGLSALRLFEAVRSSDKSIKIYQASSSEMFGSTQPPQNEKSLFQPRSPYAVAKTFAHMIARNYRESYGMHISSGILFNHESPRRSPTFVTRKITLAAAKIKLGLQNNLKLGNLHAVRDWGFAKEYVEAMWKMNQMPTSNDYVIATGIGASVKNFLETSFSCLDLDYKDYVEISEEYFRPSEVDALIGDAAVAKKELGWSHSTNWQQLAELMTKYDYENLRK
jgi:GDPmannose 4,6-dehydratase